MVKYINIGLIGAGRIAGHHLRAISSCKIFKVKAIADLDYNKGKVHAKKFGLNCYKHYDEMLKNENLDLVVILTPSGMHFQHGMDIIKKYKKHLVIEKPICMKPTEVRKLYKLAKLNKIKIYPIFQNRYNKCIKNIKKNLEQEKIGKLISANLSLRWCRPQRYYDLSIWRGTFSHDGGAFTNQGIHYIDLLKFLAGDVQSVNCKMNTFGAKIEVEDTGVGIIRFKNGALGTLEITTAARPNDYGANITLVGSKGILKIGGLAANILELYSLDRKLEKKYSQKIPDAYGYGHFETYKNIMRDILKKGKYPISYQDCYNTIKLLNCMYLSNELGREVHTTTKLESKLLGKKNHKISKLYI